MAFKASLTALDKLDLTAAHREKLIGSGIASVEELIDAIDTDARSVADMLEASDEDLRVLRSRCMKALDEGRRELIERTERRQYPLGALGRRTGNDRSR